jgi:hypothetical protein
MIIEGDKILTKVADKQFEILGEKIRFEDIPDDGLVTYVVGKKEKKDYWYNVYKFTEEQEEKWQNWAKKELRKVCADEIHLAEVFRELDLLYGFVRRYTREGELF